MTRILDAGGTILGKAICESLCFAGDSHTSDSGIARNPHLTGALPGGSSTGCAAVVTAGSVDLAIGCRSGGSMRMPASLVRNRRAETDYGLVPYTGMGPMELTFDHAGPMATAPLRLPSCWKPLPGLTVSIRASRRIGGTENYMSARSTQRARGRQIAIVKEGFGLTGCRLEPEVDERSAMRPTQLTRLGCRGRRAFALRASRRLPHLVRPIIVRGIDLELMIKGKVWAVIGTGIYPTSLRRL